MPTDLDIVTIHVYTMVINDLIGGQWAMMPTALVCDGLLRCTRLEVIIRIIAIETTEDPTLERHQIYLDIIGIGACVIFIMGRFDDSVNVTEFRITRHTVFTAGGWGVEG